jgi:exodeoxyribonuclease VIII
MTNKEYRQQPGISKSQLYEIKKTPLHFKYKLDNPISFDTPALIFGRAAHKFILEESEFFTEFAICPNVDKRTKDGKAQWELFLQENIDKDVISSDDFDKIRVMSNAIKSNKLAMMYLQGEVEQSYFWTDSVTNEQCKCRPDVVNHSLKVLADYKTTDSCQDGHFERSMKKYGYQLQAGMYTEGIFNSTLKEYGFVFVAQEKVEPYAVRVYVCKPEYITQGYDIFRECIGLYHWCKVNDNWFGYEGRDGLVTDVYGEDYQE